MFLTLWDLSLYALRFTGCDLDKRMLHTVTKRLTFEFPQAFYCPSVFKSDYAQTWRKGRVLMGILFWTLWPPKSHRKLLNLYFYILSASSVCGRLYSWGCPCKGRLDVLVSADPSCKNSLVTDHCSLQHMLGPHAMNYVASQITNLGVHLLTKLKM